MGSVNDLRNLEPFLLLEHKEKLYKREKYPVNREKEVKRINNGEIKTVLSSFSDANVLSKFDPVTGNMDNYCFIYNEDVLYFNQKFDYWSLACLLFEMCTGDSLFVHKENNKEYLWTLLSQVEELFPWIHEHFIKENFDF